MKDLYDERLDEEDLRHHKNMEDHIWPNRFLSRFFFFALVISLM